ncbi:MAG TPA: hypothetical protein VHN14_23855 [Kofleriaceae bacterium]|nr:hypothetical protein [Kofleriaceae bacterium]
MVILLVAGACHRGAVPSDAGVDARLCAARLGSGAISQWVSYDAAGKLAYQPLSDQGDRIMDYSYAGYMGGGVALPAVPAAQTVMPSGGDDTAGIQAALDAVAKQPPVGGFRGAVVLASGVFHTSAALHIDASGVVLRGSGSATTEIDMTGAPFTFLTIGGPGTWTRFLADNVRHDDRLDLVNRGTAGSGHGWAIGFGVLWNSSAAIIDAERPPGATNWAIGARGTAMGDGSFDATGPPSSRPACTRRSCASASDRRRSR